MKKPAIISDPQQIDTAWLTSALQYAGHKGKVEHFEATSIGTGQVGENVRFTLTGDNIPDTVVGKFPSPDPVSRQTGIDQRNYVREVFFYQSIKDTVDVTTPKVFFADADAQTHDFVILMEDLAPGEQGDQIEGCTADQAALAMEELAKLQGPRWGDPTLAEHELLAGSASQPEALQMLYKALEPGFIERYSSRLSTSDESVVHSVGERLDRYQAAWEGPPGLIHIDYRLDNMMFGGPYPLAVVDWQSISLGCPIADASYFLGTSLLPEVRAKEERHLLRVYLDVLKSYKVELGEDDAFDLYRNFAPGGLIMAVIASMIVGQTDRGDDMFMAMGQRSARMCEDLDAT